MEWFRRLILALISPFYFLFRPFMSEQNYRYMVCGGGNTVLDILLYFVSYNFILHKEVFFITDAIAIKPHIMAFLMSFSISFPMGFLLMSTVVFPGSINRTRVQLIRYFSVAMMNMGLTYVLLKLLVEWLHFYPTPSRVAITGIMIVISYLMQRKFTFKGAVETAPTSEQEAL